MRVLMFGWEFPPHISGGLGTACLGLTKGLSQHGVEVVFVLPKLNDGMPKEDHLKLLGVNNLELMEEKPRFHAETLKMINVNSSLRPYMSAQSYKEELRKFGKYSSVTMESRGIVSMAGDYGPDLFAEVTRYAKVAGFIAASEPHDVIHAHDWMTYLAGIEAKRRSGKPLVVHVHATEFDRSGLHVNNDIYNIEKYGMEQSDRVITVSYRTRNMVIERYGIDPSKVDVVHNGILNGVRMSRDQIDKNLSEKIVLFLGRITMQKGPDYFIDTARMVLDRMENVRFVMAGAGDLLPKMIEKMAALRMLDRFHFTGFLNGSRRERIYAMSDVYVMPSISEPFGLTPVEALQYNVPVIISKQSGVAEVLPNVRKVDFWDTHCLASAIVETLTDKQSSARMIDKTRSDLACLDWSRAAQRVISTYQKVA